MAKVPQLKEINQGINPKHLGANWKKSLQVWTEPINHPKFCGWTKSGRGEFNKGGGFLCKNAANQGVQKTGEMNLGIEGLC